MNQQLESGKAATLVFRAPQGVPTSGTITITDSTGADLPTPVTAAAVTLPSFSTTLTAAVEGGPDAKTLTVASTSGLAVGEYLLLTGADGRQEVVRAVAVSSGTVELAAPLHDDFVVGSTLASTTLTYSLTAGNTATKGMDYQAVWSYTVGGVDYVARTFFDVTSVPWYMTADEAGLFAANREVVSRAKDDGVDLGGLLETAWEEVLSRISARGWRPSLIMGMDRLAKPTYEFALLDLAEQGYTPGANTDLTLWLQHREEQAEAALDRALNGVTWYDEDHDGLAKDTNALPLTAIKLEW